MKSKKPDENFPQERKNSPINIREAVEADISFILDSQLKMALETEGMTLDRETVHQGIRALFLDPKKGNYWIAHADQPVGCVLILPEWSDWRNGTVLWIHSLYVIPEYRKSGVFFAIYDSLKTRVQETSGLYGLRLYVDRRNTLAQKAYERVGMSTEHYTMFEWMKDF